MSGAYKKNKLSFKKDNYKIKFQYKTKNKVKIICILNLSLKF